MATQRNRFNPDQPEAAEQERRRDQPVPDAPATVPHSGEGIEPGGSRPPEDGGVERIRSTIPMSKIWEEMTDEVEKTGIKTDT